MEIGGFAVFFVGVFLFLLGIAQLLWNYWSWAILSIHGNRLLLYPGQDAGELSDPRVPKFWEIGMSAIGASLVLISFQM